jgi:hypothetical protein
MLEPMVRSPSDVERSPSAGCWAAVFAGGLAAGVVSLALLILGAGLGLTVISPWANAGAAAKTLGVGAIIWLIVMQWLSAGIGSYLAGRLRAV